MEQRTVALPLSADELRSKLKGVRADVGSLVSFRDEPAFEMVMRLNRRHNGALVCAVFSNKGGSGGAEGRASGRDVSGGGGRVAGCGTQIAASRAGGAMETRMVFVPKAYGAFLEEEMQKWLDPFSGRGETAKRKRGRERERERGDDDGHGTDVSSDVDFEDREDCKSLLQVRRAVQSRGRRDSSRCKTLPLPIVMVVERDRSNELHSIFNGMMHSEAVPRAGVHPGDPSQRGLLQSSVGLRSSNETQIFTRFAQAFSTDLAKVSESIMRLTQLTQRQSVFEDRSPEVTALTQVVKTSLQRLHTDLNTLDELKARALAAEKVELARTRAAGGGEMHSLWGGKPDVESLVQSQTKHSDTIVDTLRSRLARTGQTFRSTLQQQTREMKSNAQRRHMFTTGERPQTFESALFHDQDMQQQQQMQLASRGENVHYYKLRSEAVREIEAAVVEVGEMFNDFTRLVHEQNEIVLRIDTNVETSLRHVNAGSNELLRYLANLTSNRGLIIKIFAVLFVFLLFFGFLVVR